MARFFTPIVLLLAAALANESSNMPEEFAEFRQEVLKNLNKTKEMLYRLMRIVYEQPAEMRKLVEEQKEELVKFANATNDKLDQLAKNADQRYNQVSKKDSEFEEKRKNDREKVDALANFTERHIKHFHIRFSSKCNLARFSNLTVLSNGKVYSFHQTRANWNSANETCSKKGLHLATTKDSNDAQVVAAEAKRIHSSNVWWVSAKNQGSGSEKDFRWRDGTKLELESPLWMDSADKTKDCIYTHNWPKGKFYSSNCTNNYYFICELPSECY
ncbi:uncharacterized protein LOC132194002 [Neocloeon triangulifer]|uniref:uncharacterized protein LOC132194002 n=1 Tax=Neocloeon triangulifer TaxID=2078957 RepID=UPI00286EFB56|nr:uncharacterized protein LOC132194002 [Neocloeon triangulifer]